MKGSLMRLVPLAGRLLLAQIFLFSGINKLLHSARTIELISSRGIPFPMFCCFAAAAIELAGALALIFGIKVRWSALVLAGFVLLVTTLFHWDFTKDINAQLFRKDLAIVGGLLLAAHFASDT